MAAAVPVYQMDANVLLRFLREDHTEFSPRAKRLIDRANRGEIILEVSAVIVSEVFYAMKTSYHLRRREAAKTLAQVLNTPAFSLAERTRVLDALSRVESANVDFGDAYLASIAAETKTPIASFDRDLERFADVTRHEP